MDLVSTIKFLTMVVSIYLAILVVKRYSDSKLNNLFALYVLSIAAQSFVEFQLSIVRNLDDFLFWKHFDVITFSTVAFLFHFILLYIKINPNTTRWLAAAVYILSSIFLVLNAIVFCPYTANIESGSFNSVLTENSKYFFDISLVISGIIAISSFLLSLKFYLNSTEKRIRLQSGFMMLSLAILVGCGIFFEIIAPFVLKMPAIPLNMSATTAFLIVNPIMAFAIIRYDVLRIQPETATKEVLERLADSVFFIDIDGRIQYVNQAGAMLLGMGQDAVLGIEFKELLHLPSKEFKESFEDLFSSKEKKFIDQEAILRHTEGQLIPISISCINYTSRHWGLMGIIITVRDISERKKSQELRESIEKILHHDLRTPLMAVVGYPELLLRDKNLDEHQRRILVETGNSGKRMLNMIDSYLNLQKIERGIYKQKNTPVDLLEIVSNAIDCTRMAGRCGHASFEVSLNSSSLKPADKVVVMSDESLMTSMFTNLIQNAAEASPEGGKVSIRIHTSKGLRIDIHNLGVIPSDIRDVFFTKYSTSGKRAGTGLGAYSSRLIAETLGGKISFTTNETVGTTITVAFDGMKVI